jgi:hypothetical protein
MIRSLFIASAAAAAAALAFIRLPFTPAGPCRSAVVWLDIPTGIYYRKSERRYGRTDRGAYTCENLAISAGHRAHLV